MLREDLERKVVWLGHAGFRLKTAAGIVYIDPYRAPAGPAADVVLITHDHFDHFSRDDLRSLVAKGTRLVAPATVAEQLKGPAVSIRPGQTVEVGGMEVTGVAAYNTNKTDSSGKAFHPRESGWVGYVIESGGSRIYHSGDTDVIPEMDEAAGVDVALLPVSGTYVMTAAEAAEAARRIEPKIAVPMHWGTVIGSREDAEEFASKAPVEVVILETESEGEAVGRES
jgi:L-ascorbate metabolism protein UlaG (beta-lactamase superfamily)